MNIIAGKINDLEKGVVAFYQKLISKKKVKKGLFGKQVTDSDVGMYIGSISTCVRTLWSDFTEVVKAMQRDKLFMIDDKYITNNSNAETSTTTTDSTIYQTTNVNNMLSRNRLSNNTTSLNDITTNMEIIGLVENVKNDIINLKQSIPQQVQNVVRHEIHNINVQSSNFDGTTKRPRAI